MKDQSPITDAREFEILSDLQSGTRKVVDASVCRQIEATARQLGRENAKLREALEGIVNPTDEARWIAARNQQQFGLITSEAAMEKARAALNP